MTRSWIEPQSPRPLMHTQIYTNHTIMHIYLHLYIQMNTHIQIHTQIYKYRYTHTEERETEGMGASSVIFS